MCISYNLYYATILKVQDEEMELQNAVVVSLAEDEDTCNNHNQLVISEARETRIGQDILEVYVLLSVNVENV